MKRKDRKPVGIAFWLGTLAYGCLLWVWLAASTEEVVFPGFAALAFCWLGGLLAQAAVDVLRGSRSGLFRRAMWRWVVAMVAYYIVAGFLFYWIEAHVHGNWAFPLGLIIMLLPFIWLLPRWLAENTRRREMSANHTSDGIVAKRAEPSR
jgi:hypothetical protein